MKKIFTIAFSLIFLATYSQDKSDKGWYGSLSGEFGIHKATGVSGGFAVTAGFRPKRIFGAGIGIEAIKFVKRKSIYLPVYADFRYYFPPGDIFQAYFIAQSGYGLYNSTQTHTSSINNGSSNTTIISSLTSKGGFYFGSGFGLSGKGKFTPAIAIRYTSYGYTYKKTGNYFKENSSERAIAITLNFGVSF